MNDRKTEVAAGLRKTLDRHGYSFQYSVLKTAEEIARIRRSFWRFEVAEFPVQVNGRDARIDFILRHTDIKTLMVAECKRANPAWSNWCFLKLPYLRRNRSGNQFLLEHLATSSDTSVTSGVTDSMLQRDIYHLGLEVRTGETGDPGGPGRGAIEGAATQVMRGANGLAEHLAEEKQQIDASRGTWLLPVIFTTAELWVTEADVSDAALETGELGSIPEVAPVPWLWFRYHQSPGLRHTIASRMLTPRLEESLDYLYARTIAVVGASGVEQFLTHEWW